RALVAATARRSPPAVACARHGCVRLRQTSPPIRRATSYPSLRLPSAGHHPALPAYALRGGGNELLAVRAEATPCRGAQRARRLALRSSDDHGRRLCRRLRRSLLLQSQLPRPVWRDAPRSAEGAARPALFVAGCLARR